ncbi:MAG: type IV pili twitching motility protein PilT [Candidatus Cloacimonadota bacterium]|nr:MAG: type IV pili twitching motility protein PilT [Candidatus Cloacimonadota bacterium]PIE81429.1 MAG: type IV pili twitching motility protein PilT [Candidatus Delongbacteria bacterium]
MIINEDSKLVDLRSLLEILVDKKGSDLHICAGSPPVMRLDGSLIRLNFPPLTPKETKAIAYSALNEFQKSMFEKNLSIDLSISIRGLSRFRLNIYYQRGAISCAFRTIPYDIFTFEEAGLPPVASSLCEKPNGIVLITGATGSGKSSTLATMVDRINSEQPKHILTIEDPIEYLHKSKKAIVNQRELGIDFKSFSEALKSALRQDPDVILVGEMRDKETIELALSAAETGHLVFATLHTSSASGTITRIIDTFPEMEQEQVRTQLGMMLRGVICQKLLPKIGGGRCLACEVLIGTPAINSLIRENKIHQIESMIQVSQKYGMMTLNQHLTHLVKIGKIDVTTAVQSCNTYISELLDLLKREGIN